jgi:diphthamide synthase (EF-2-diphthine--ammonia ligase)
MLAALGRLKAEGVEVVLFGAIFLEDLRAYRDRLLGLADREGLYPLRGRVTGECYDEFIGLGYKAIKRRSSSAPACPPCSTIFRVTTRLSAVCRAR